MRYTLEQIGVRPWTVSYLSVKLIESHSTYERSYPTDFGTDARAIVAPMKLATV